MDIEQLLRTAAQMQQQAAEVLEQLQPASESAWGRINETAVAAHNASADVFLAMAEERKCQTAALEITQSQPLWKPHQRLADVLDPRD